MVMSSVWVGVVGVRVMMSSTLPDRVVRMVARHARGGHGAELGVRGGGVRVMRVMGMVVGSGCSCGVGVVVRVHGAQVGAGIHAPKIRPGSSRGRSGVPLAVRGGLGVGHRVSRRTATTTTTITTIATAIRTRTAGHGPLHAGCTGRGRRRVGYGGWCRERGDGCWAPDG